MNIFDNIKRRISNTWREQSSTEVIDLSDDSDSEVSQQSVNSTHRRSNSTKPSSSRNHSSSTDHSGRSSIVSTSRLSSASSSTSTPKYGGRQMTLADAMQKFQTIPATPETPEPESSPAVQVVAASPMSPTFTTSPPVMQVQPKPSSSILVPLGIHAARQSRSPVYSQKEQDAAKYRATLTETIFAKKEQLKKLEVKY